MRRSIQRCPREGFSTIIELRMGVPNLLFKKKIISPELLFVLSYLHPYMLGLAGVFVLTFGQSYSFALLPKFSTKFLFELISPEKIHLLYKYFFIILGIILAKAFLQFVKAYTMRAITQSAIKKIRDDFFSHLMTLDIDFFSKNETGNIITIGINDIENIKNHFYQDLIGFVSGWIMLAVVVARLFTLNWFMTLVSFGSLPVLYLALKSVGMKIRVTSRKLRSNLADLSVDLHETLTGIEVVKSFAQEEQEIREFKKNTKKYKRTFLRLAALTTFFNPLSETIVYLFVLILMAVGTSFILKGKWDTKGLMEYIMLLAMMNGPMNGIPKFISEFKMTTASIERFISILAIKPKIQEIPNPVSRKLNGSIAAKKIWFSYDLKNWVLKGISFSAYEGEVVALVGPSGAGKTTFVKLIPRFYDCTKGGLYIDGVDVRDYSLNTLRTQIGIVSQNVVLFNTSIYENIKYAKSDATEEEVVRAAKKAYAYDFIMEFPDRFETNVGERGVRLSGGQKQRIAIARTLLVNPQILILDEATSSLDSESERYIQLAVKNLMEGRTSIIIAHRLSTIVHATKILVMDKGKILDVGTHEDLLKRCPFYKKIYKLQYTR
jgi:ATP-binding cassette, subfamily B, bacterial MsbA